jgi:hypothetical protein
MSLLWFSIQLRTDRTIKEQNVHNYSFVMSQWVVG